MAEPGTFVAARPANALIPDAEASDRAAALAQTYGRFDFRGLLERFRQRQGGLWVGGTVTLTDQALAFAPNSANAAAHQGDPSWRVPLARLTRIEVRNGVLTRIVDVHFGDSSLVTFRCFGARGFADQIEAATRAARQIRSADKPR